MPGNCKEADPAQFCACCNMKSVSQRLGRCLLYQIAQSIPIFTNFILWLYT